MTIIKTTIQVLLLVIVASTHSIAQETKEDIIVLFDQNADKNAKTAKQIWDGSEVGYQEEKSSALLQTILKEDDFKVQSGVAGMPTSFMATCGRGSAEIAILTEFDALPGLSQKTTPSQEPVSREGAGHACGHHLFGTGFVASAIAIKDWLKIKQSHDLI